MSEHSTSWWRSRTKIPIAVFLAIGAYFLWTEHQAHVIEFLPWVLVIACVGMHLFMHGGHGKNSGGRAERSPDTMDEGDTSR